MSYRISTMPFGFLIFALLLQTGQSFVPTINTIPRVRSSVNVFMTSSATPIFKEHVTFMENVAKTVPPRRLEALLQLLEMSADESIVGPSARENLNPFLIPLSKSKKDGSMLCYIRWPTQKDSMDLQLVRTTEVGIYLVAMGTDQYCHRLAVEQEFFSQPSAPLAIEILNAAGQMYTAGDYTPFLKSGKFPTTTEADLKLVLDRYLLTKVGAFPDCYERLATNFWETNNEVSALVTCERAVSIFYGWGHPVNFHAKLMSRIPGREKEARDAARASLGQPAWTVGKDAQVIVNERMCCRVIDSITVIVHDYYPSNTTCPSQTLKGRFQLSAYIITTSYIYLILFKVGILFSFRCV